MSMNNLTIDGEFRYIVQWFNEWSELQRDDFVPILVKYITGSNTSEDDDNDDGLAAAVATTPVNMNGLPNDLEFNGRPMSLFQCRIKLFNQWNRRWPTDFKEKLQQKIVEIDGKVGEKIKLALNPNNIGNLTNGYASIEEDPHSLEQLKENGDNLVIVAANNHAVEIEAMALNDPMTEVLNNETSVDDIETNEDVSNSIEQPLFNNNMVTNTSSAPLQTGINNDDNNDVAVAAVSGKVNNDDVDDNDEVCSNNTRHNNAINERGEPVEQVVEMQNLQINEEKAEAEKDHEDVTAITLEQKQQQPLPTITVTVNPVVVTQTITTNAEVPLVV